jgi:hypothetical protein
MITLTIHCTPYTPHYRLLKALYDHTHHTLHTIHSTPYTPHYRLLKALYDGDEQKGGGKEDKNAANAKAFGKGLFRGSRESPAKNDGGSGGGAAAAAAAPSGGGGGATDGISKGDAVCAKLKEGINDLIIKTLVCTEDNIPYQVYALTMHSAPLISLCNIPYQVYALTMHSAPLINIRILSFCNIPYQVNSFEVFGFDVLIDQALKPWLIEVNASPSMSRDNDLGKQ